MDKMPESMWSKPELRARVIAAFLRIVIEAVVLNHLFHKEQVTTLNPEGAIHKIAPRALLLT